ncbi:hypothetical protein H2248_007088 [Termitomyces sp. 'cryptogamus']|nr:hypothetical protein H2248_007088 [Termitomyces sp. 'cryptogamus']
MPYYGCHQPMHAHPLNKPQIQPPLTPRSPRAASSPSHTRCAPSHPALEPMHTYRSIHSPPLHLAYVVHFPPPIVIIPLGETWMRCERTRLCVGVGVGVSVSAH